MDEIARELGLPIGEFARDGSYVIDIDDSNQFGKIYSKLENNDEIKDQSDNALVTIHGASLLYLYGNVQINLTADYDEDIYKCILTNV